MNNMKGNAIEVMNYLDKWKEGQIFVCAKYDTKEGRTLYQNNFFYWLFSDIEKQSPFSLETIKQYILWRVFWKKEVYWELVNNRTHTSKLTKKEAIELINWIIAFCEEHTLKMSYYSSDLKSLEESYN